MPELPDVEVYRRYVDSTSLHEEVIDVWVSEARIVGNMSMRAFARELAGSRFVATHRHGKYLFIALEETQHAGRQVDDRYLILHFGMTGRLAYYRDAEDEPQYTQARFDLANGYHLAVPMPRKLGELRLIKSRDAFLRSKRLGPDVYRLDRDRFCDLLQSRRGMIKPALMDQSLMAGLGNVYSDEILHQAAVHPRRPIERLSRETLATLHDARNEVLETAIRCQADPERLPETYITPRREVGAPCPKPGCGGSLERIEVGGRAGYYCPSCQQMS